MTEPNWATREAYNWLANDEGAYNQIMDSPGEDRLDVLRDILEFWLDHGEMTAFTRHDFDSIDWGSLVADFADEPGEPRYEHDCNGCTFLGQNKEYDLYYHSCSTFEQVFAKCDDGEKSILMALGDLEMLNRALTLAIERGLHDN